MVFPQRGIENPLGPCGWVEETPSKRRTQSQRWAEDSPESEVVEKFRDHDTELRHNSRVNTRLAPTTLLLLASCSEAPAEGMPPATDSITTGGPATTAADSATTSPTEVTSTTTLGTASAGEGTTDASVGDTTGRTSTPADSTSEDNGESTGEGTTSGATTATSDSGSTSDSSAGSGSSSTSAEGTTSSTTAVESSSSTGGSCPAGQQDNDGNGVCEPACEARSCSGQGTCSDASGQIVCSCDGFYRGTNCEICAPSPLIDDRFSNGDLATGGAGETNAGFVYVANTADMGSAVEASGVLTVSTDGVPGGANPNMAAQSLSTFNAATSNAVTLVVEVTAADEPALQGIAVAVHADPGIYVGAGRPALEFHVTGNTGFLGITNEVAFITREANNDRTVYSTEPYTPADLADGFNVTMTLSSAGWSYRVEGLAAAPIEDSGSYDPGVGFDELLDAGSHVSLAIQGLAGDDVPISVVSDRTTLLDGICARGFSPTLP